MVLRRSEVWSASDSSALWLFLWWQAKLVGGVAYRREGAVLAIHPESPESRVLLSVGTVSAGPRRGDTEEPRRGQEQGPGRACWPLPGGLATASCRPTSPSTVRLIPPHNCLAACRLRRPLSLNGQRPARLGSGRWNAVLWGGTRSPLWYERWFTTMSERLDCAAQGRPCLGCPAVRAAPCRPVLPGRLENAFSAATERRAKGATAAQPRLPTAPPSVLASQGQ
jgi:hypothetical protein